MRYTGQCSHGMPLGKRCAKCDESPMADFATVKIKNLELQAGAEEGAALRAEVSALRTRAEAAERERDEFKECYRLAMVSVNDAYDKGYTSGQRDMRETAVTVCIRRNKNWDELPQGLAAGVTARATEAKGCAEDISALPIKGRP